MKSLTKHFALLELGNNECPMIGVLTFVEQKNFETTFNQKFFDAVCSHFDCDDFNYDQIEDLFDGQPYWDIMIEINGSNYEIRIIETWLY